MTSELTNEAQANDLRANERIASYCHIKYD